MTGIDEDIVVQQTKAIHDGVVELGCEFLDLVCSEQVGPANLADEERVAGKERDRIWSFGGINQQVGEVLVRVPRGPECVEYERPDWDDAAIGHGPVRERLLAEPARVEWPLDDHGAA